MELGRRWPEQSYDFESRVQFSRMNDIFFSDQGWDLTGVGDVTGKFSLFKGGHDLVGTFTSDVLGWNEYRFPDLFGNLRWTPTAFDVTNAGAAFFGGAARFAYSMKPLGQGVRSTSRFEASYQDADLAEFTGLSGWPVCVLPGSGPGTTCSNGRQGALSSGLTKAQPTVAPPPGVRR